MDGGSGGGSGGRVAVFVEDDEGEVLLFLGDAELRRERGSSETALRVFFEGELACSIGVSTSSEANVDGASFFEETSTSSFTSIPSASRLRRRMYCCRLGMICAS